MASIIDYIFNIGGNYTATINGMSSATGNFSTTVDGDIEISKSRFFCCRFGGASLCPCVVERGSRGRSWRGQLPLSSSRLGRTFAAVPGWGGCGCGFHWRAVRFGVYFALGSLTSHAMSPRFGVSALVIRFEGGRRGGGRCHRRAGMGGSDSLKDG